MGESSIDRQISRTKDMDIDIYNNDDKNDVEFESTKKNREDRDPSLL